MKRLVIFLLIATSAFGCCLPALTVCAETENVSACEARDTSTVTDSEAGAQWAPPTGRVAKSAEYFIYAVTSLLSVLCISYLLFIMNRERKNDDG